MRVLVVHNHYSSRVPSGENLAVRDEVAWLREAGVDVHLHGAHNDDALDTGAMERARQAIRGPWSLPARRAMERRLDEVAPDLVHVHNVFPLLTASVVRAATVRGVPVVWTAHNRRTTCVEGTNSRDGAPCTACRPGRRLPGIRHACYAGSAAASAVVTTGTSVFRWLARRQVTTIAVSEHMRGWLLREAGFEPDRVRVKHNGVAGPPAGTAATPAAESRTFLFVGRLDRPKGVGLLLDAWARTKDELDARLHILGDGAMAPDVRAAATADSRITWFGAVPPSEVVKHLADARAVVVPATVEESFGRVAAEALAYRRGLIATRRGGLSEIIEPGWGWAIDPEPSSLAAALVAAGDPATDLTARTRAGYDRYERLFSPEATTAALLEVYREVVG